MTTIDLVTFCAFQEQAQHWRQVQLRVEAAFDAPASERTKDERAELVAARYTAAVAVSYWTFGVRKWLHVPAEA